MTTFTTRIPNEEDASNSNDNTLNTKDQFSGRFSGIKDMLRYQSRIRTSARYLVRIITVIFLAAVVAGLFELLR